MIEKLPNPGDSLTPLELRNKIDELVEEINTLKLIYRFIHPDEPQEHKSLPTKDDTDNFA